MNQEPPQTEQSERFFQVFAESIGPVFVFTNQSPTILETDPTLPPLIEEYHTRLTSLYNLLQQTLSVITDIERLRCRNIVGILLHKLRPFLRPAAA